MTPDPQISLGKYFRQCVGIDVSKQKFTACLGMLDISSDTGCFTQSVDFHNNKTGFNQLVRWSRREAQKGFDLPFLMEATGVYHEKLASHLNKIGCTVYVVVPNKARDFADYEGLKLKTDAVDARVLALLGCVNRHIKPWEPVKSIYAELRQMTRFRSHLNDLRTTIGNLMESISHSQAADKTIIREYGNLMKTIDKKMEKNERRIMEKISEDKELKAKFDNLCTIKGLGPITIACIIGETNGFNLITNRKQLASYAGLDIKTYQSGNLDCGHHITKRGNKYIRAALYFPAIVACRHNNQVKGQYERVCDKHPETKLVGITAAMRKLLLLTFTLWKSGEAYNPERMK